MLSESFIAACGPQSNVNQIRNPTAALKDASIAVHTLYPLPAPRQAFKKSCTAQNCIAVTDEHIFAAQADKAVVNVYSRERGNQEAIVPFQEKVTSLDVAADGTVLVMGTEGGRVVLWETCTGRFISTPPTHLQPVICIAVSPTSTHLLTGSADSTIHVWSLPALLSFSSPTSFSSDQRDPKSPIHSLTSQRSAITALAISAISGIGSIAVSASEDGTAIVWDYAQGQLLRTFLLADTPRALVLDPADRAFFAGYNDGSVQLVDFINDSGLQEQGFNGISPLWAEGATATPVQPAKSGRWELPEQQGSPAGAVLSLALSWDGTALLSGHEGGQVMAWDVGGGKWKSTILTLSGPVTNLQTLEITGLPKQTRKKKRKIKVDKVVKPRFDEMGGAAQGYAGNVPGNYTFQAQFLYDLRDHDGSNADGVIAPLHSAKGGFEASFYCSTGFPQDELEAGIAELKAWRKQSQGYTSLPTSSDQNASTAAAPDGDDFVSLENEQEANKGKRKAQGAPVMTIEQQNEVLRKKVAALQRVQRVTFRQLDDLRAERQEYQKSSGGRGRGHSGTNVTESTARREEDEMNVDEDAGAGAEDELTAGAEDLVEGMEQEEEDEKTDHDDEEEDEKEGSDEEQNDESSDQG